MKIAVILIVLDIVTGLISALVSHSFKSSIMRAGGLKKSAELALLIGVKAIQKIDISYYDYTRIVTYYIIIMEAASIAENFNKLYPDNPLSRKLKEIFGGNKNDIQ